MSEDHVPEAVAEKILILLPPTTLVRLSSVSKSWHSLIHSHSFTNSHFQLSLSNPIITPPLLLIQRSTPFFSRWSLFDISPFPFLHLFSTLEPPYRTLRSFHLVQSLYGVVCLTLHDPHSIILWNPSVHRYLTLHPPPLNPKALGFGFDSKNHDFKVIRIGNSCRVMLYSINEGVWRDVDFSCKGELGFRVLFSLTSCFLNGNVHWIVQNSLLLVLVFNVEEEKFNTMELPSELLNLSPLQLKVTVVEGCLAVLLYDNVDWLDIWMMREYGVSDSWTKISTPHLQGRTRDAFGLSTSSKVLVPWSSQVGIKFTSLYSLDPKNQEITDLGIRGRSITACEYTGSLFLLDKAIV